MRVLDQPAERDLGPFSRYLWVQRIRHRIYEEAGRQVIEVARPEDASLVRSAFAAWDAGQLVVPALEAPAPQPVRFGSAIRRYPLLLSVLTLSAVVFLLTGGGQGGVGLQRLLHFYDPAVPPQVWTDAFTTGQFWRLVTPAFIHLSLLHIIFNSLIVWELGRRIEPALSALQFVLLFCAIAAVSHIAQYLTGRELFGGLSGVAYGFLGYVLVRARLQPARPRWHLAPGFAISLLIMLVAFTFGAGLLLGIKVANGAHWGGLVAGLGLAYLIRPRDDGVFHG
ncbi:MAG: rhomboid family intramembrane serine protease [Pseudomonadota bacterium]